MDNASSRSQRPSQPDRQSFSPRTHPDRPPERSKRDTPGAEQGDRHYPERCNPNRTRPPLDEDQRGLATRYLPLARSMARRMKASFPSAGDELQSAAFLALVEAAQSFDPSRSVNFATYARYRIWGALCDVRREIIGKVWPTERQSATVVMRLGDDSESHGRVIGAEPDEPVGNDMEILDTVENWIRRLPRPHSLAFRHIYLDGKTQEETATLVGCSKSTLSRMHSQAITWLQQAHGFERRD